MLSLVLLREVMDKEPPLWALWSIALSLATGGFLLARRWRLGGWIAALIAAILASSVISELRDPYVGPAILAEAGPGYKIQAYLLSAVSVAAPIIGALRSRRSVRTAA
jgi:hypothetical protein